MQDLINRKFETLKTDFGISSLQLGCKMDDSRQHESGRHKVEYYRGTHSPVIGMHFPETFTDIFHFNR